MQLKALVRRLRGRRTRPQKAHQPGASALLYDRAAADSADFIAPHLAGALLMRRSDRIRDYAIREAPRDGLLLELGVYKGESLNQFAAVLADRGDRRTIHGFDAFEGLSEDWHGKALSARAFSRRGRRPRVRPNSALVVGWLDDTLAPFLAAHAGPVAFVHIDTDTYTPCRLALDLLKPRLRPGSLILFDEHHGYPNWRNNEYRALNEVFSPDAYRYRAFADEQALIEIRAPAGHGDAARGPLERGPTADGERP